MWLVLGLLVLCLLLGMVGCGCGSGGGLAADSPYTVMLSATRAAAQRSEHLSLQLVVNQQ